MARQKTHAEYVEDAAKINPKDGATIFGAISIGLITEEEALKQLELQNK